MFQKLYFSFYSLLPSVIIWENVSKVSVGRKETWRDRLSIDLKLQDFLSDCSRLSHERTRCLLRIMSHTTFLLLVHSPPFVRSDLFLTVPSPGTKEKYKPKFDVKCHTICLLKSAVLLRCVELKVILWYCCPSENIRNSSHWHLHIRHWKRRNHIDVGSYSIFNYAEMFNLEESTESFSDRFFFPSTLQSLRVYQYFRCTRL